MRNSSFIFLASLIVLSSLFNSAEAQQYKLTQSNSMMGMKSTSTIYVKGMRKRTEGGGIMGIGANIVTIEQCDLQRTVKLNDKKKLYFIEPFETGNEEVIDEDAVKAKPTKQTIPNTVPEKGGVITQWYSIRDTNERKTMFGFPARHVWTSRKTKPSPDACYMKDSMLMKTDGWYIDLPQFICPVHYKPMRPPRQTNEPVKPQCMDKFVTHRSGKGKLGFPLTETTTIIMGGGSGPQATEITTSIETVDFSTAKLDSMLFEIPPGYTEAKSEDELQDKFSMADMIKNAKQNNNNDNNGNNNNNNNNIISNIQGMINNQAKKPGVIRIGVYEPKGEGGFQAPGLQLHMVNDLKSGNVEAIAVASEEDAKKYDCDYT